MSRLPLRTLLKLMYLWSVQDKVSKAVKECGVSKRVVVDWYNQERIKGEGAYNVKYRKIRRAALNLGDYVR